MFVAYSVETVFVILEKSVKCSIKSSWNIFKIFYKDLMGHSMTNKSIKCSIQLSWKILQMFYGLS